jgi:hypothetical protein
MGGKILLVMAKLFIRIGPRTCIPVTRSMKEPAVGVSIPQRLGNEFNVGERRLKISDDRPDAILFILAERLGCGPGRHKANYRFFELPIRLVRNNPHV